MSLALKIDAMEAIKDHHSKTNVMCGLLIATLRYNLNVPYQELKPILTELYKEKFFHIRPGINGQMIFKTTT